MAQTTQRKANNRRETKPGPVWSRRYWTGKATVEVSVWSHTREGENGDREVFSTTLKKTYKDGDEYKESDSFFPEELPLVAAALQEAFHYISEVQHPD